MLNALVRNVQARQGLLRSALLEEDEDTALLGDLGSRDTRLEVGVFRGFALADDFVPFIVVNPADSPGAKSFTLMHELAHLWLGESRISGGSASPTDPVEVFCNTVASIFLVPDEELADFPGLGQDDLGDWGQQIRHKLGPALVETVFRLMASGALSATKGARVLGVNPRNAHTIRARG